MKNASRVIERITDACNTAKSGVRGITVANQDGIKIKIESDSKVRVEIAQSRVGIWDPVLIAAKTLSKHEHVQTETKINKPQVIVIDPK